MTLNNQATPVPIAISVNMFSFRVRTEVQPRSKNGQPAHNTTGVARTSWIHAETPAEMVSRIAGTRSAPMPSTSTGIASAAATQNRRVMSASSGLGPESAVTVTGSSAIPQIGHAPGAERRISGCIGHVHSATSPAVALAAGATGCPAWSDPWQACACATGSAWWWWVRPAMPPG